ncbi:type VII secretion integral membrane protein EccD [Labedaea rhizosphaerae]|nr:type VII secretion integral membrane protein EccD [Labedaea rhizosphaerae]
MPVQLVRVTIAAPKRRMDLALPEDAVVAEIIPGLLARAGEELADDGLDHGGWVLRRFDGAPLTHTRTLAAHRLRDGEVLRLAPRRLEWPELEYDDLVDAIATGAKKRARWAPRYTRTAGLAIGAVALLLGLVAVANAGPDWAAPARWAFGQAVLLLVVGIVLARVVGDSVAGALAGLVALPYAFAGGALSQAGAELELRDFGAPQLLVGCAALAAFGLVGYIAVGDGTWLFAGGVATGLFGMAGAWLGTDLGLPADHVAAVLVGFLLPLSPLFGSLAIRLGKLPLPVLPRTTADLVRDDPQPPRSLVYRAVNRADALLTGMLTGASVVCTIGIVTLLRTGSMTAQVLALIASAAFLLRARLHPIVRQRVPLLVTGLTGPAVALVGLASPGNATGLTVGASGVVALGAAAIAIGIVYSRRATSPYLGRSAEFAEVLLILTVVPLACSVLGLYGWLRGLGG